MVTPRSRRLFDSFDRTDPALDVRLEAIHLICDLAYRPKASRAIVANCRYARVSAKHKQERQDTLAGQNKNILPTLYADQRVKNIQAAGTTVI
jgi:hypothetical protein